MGLLIVWSLLALPGVVLNGPIFILASVISHKKAKGALVLFALINPMDASDPSHRSPRRLRGQNRRQRRPRDLEDPRRFGCRAPPLRLLGLPGHLAGGARGRAFEVEGRDAVHCVHGAAVHELCGAEVWGGGDGCDEVSFRVHCVVAVVW